MRRLWFIALLGFLPLPEIVKKLCIAISRILQMVF